VRFFSSGFFRSDPACARHRETDERAAAEAAAAATTTTTRRGRRERRAPGSFSPVLGSVTNATRSDPPENDVSIPSLPCVALAHNFLASDIGLRRVERNGARAAPVVVAASSVADRLASRLDATSARTPRTNAPKPLMSRVVVVVVVARDG